MSELNKQWAIEELEKFIAQTVLEGDFYGFSQQTVSPDEEVISQAAVVEKILDRELPQWRTKVWSEINNRWSGHREAAIRAKELIERQGEIELNLGDSAPSISAATLHPWVWSAAAPLWESRHYRSAVEDAAKKVNAETQNKLDRRDVSETKLFQEAFSLDSPASGKPRMRRMKEDGSDTYKSLQSGAMAFAQGIYAGIRNPLNHEDPKDIDEQIALEYLAALSVLARWVDEAELVQ